MGLRGVPRRVGTAGLREGTPRAAGMADRGGGVPDRGEFEGRPREEPGKQV